MEVVIIGAGLSGLAAAHAFSKKGHQVKIFEASDRAGGRSQILQHKDLIIDVGTQYYHTNYKRALKLIKENDLEKNLYKISGYTQFSNPQESFLLNQQLPYLKKVGLTNNLRALVFLIKQILQTRQAQIFGLDHKNRKDKLIDSNEHADVISKYVLRSITLAGALTDADASLMGEIQLQRLIKIVLLTHYLSLSTGVASLHHKLASTLNIDYETKVDKLIINNNRASGVLINNREIKADHVIIATEAPSVSNLLPDEWHSEKDFFQSIQAPSFILPTFFLNRPLQKRVWSYMLDKSTGCMIDMVIDASQKNPNMVPSGNAVIQPWICYPNSTKLIGLSQDAIIKLCIVELEQHLFPGFSNWIEDIKITYHPSAVPFHKAGHAEKAKQLLSLADQKNVSYCGDYLTGGYMEAALWTVDRAVRFNAH
jgi:protoporphyrinogen oxidase